MSGDKLLTGCDTRLVPDLHGKMAAVVSVAYVTTHAFVPVPVVFVLHFVYRI
jgi:uncharacterized membrane protein YwaF